MHGAPRAGLLSQLPLASCEGSLTEAVSFCLGHSSSKAGTGRDLAHGGPN